MARRSEDPIAPSALRGAMITSVLVLLVALIGAAVRLFPWVLDPNLPWATLAPFAKSLGSVAVEAALLTGWPVGWALATQRLVERGEASVLVSLGESPARTVTRLLPQGLVFVSILGLTSVSFGREAVAPGRIVGSLLSEGRAACARPATAHATHVVPFVSATWLCGDEAPRLVGRAPMGGLAFSASGARVADDLRRIDLEDAHLSLPSPGGDGARVRVHVGALSLGGMSPWARASSLPPLLRALVVTSSGLFASSAAVFVLLFLRQRRVGAVAAVLVGAAGPIAALGSLRALEVRVPEVAPGAWLGLFVLVPVVATVAVLLAARAAIGIGRLRRRARTPGRL